MQTAAAEATSAPREHLKNSIRQYSRFLTVLLFLTIPLLGVWKVETARAQAEPQLINDSLALADLRTSYSPDTQGGACPGGLFPISATFTNASLESFADIFFEVVTLTGGNTVLNADGGPGGAGSTIPVPSAALGGNGILDLDESFTQVFDICLARRARFEFFVNVFVRDQCRESTVEIMLGAAAKNPVANAAFQDSWQLATDLGFDPSLNSVVECDLPNNFKSYTAALGSLEGLAAISIIFGEDSQDAWAPIMLSPGPSTLKIFDRSGGLLIKEADAGAPTLIELDANGDPVQPLGSETSSFLELDNLRTLFVPASAIASSPTCQEHFYGCLAGLGADILQEIFRDTITLVQIKV